MLAVSACCSGELSENLVLGNVGENQRVGAPWGAEPPATVSLPAHASMGTFTDFTARTYRPGKEMSLGFADEKEKGEGTWYRLLLQKLQGRDACQRERVIKEKGWL